jgi:hypothetical protein
VLRPPMIASQRLPHLDDRRGAGDFLGGRVTCELTAESWPTADQDRAGRALTDDHRRRPSATAGARARGARVGHETADHPPAGVNVLVRRGVSGGERSPDNAEVGGSIPPSPP